MKRLKYFFYSIKQYVHNFILVQLYPFLKPSCGYGTSMYYHRPGYKYHYEETWMDEVPEGWQQLVIHLCTDLKKIIKRDNLKDYKITQVKEKWGFLHWYDEGGNEATKQLIREYEKLSQYTCIRCGKTPTKYVTPGWITYICEDCARKYYKDQPEKIQLKKEIS